MNKRRLIGYFCLSLYLLAWLGSAQAIPLLLASVGHAHKLFLTYHGDTLRIKLHHPGHADEHEPLPAAPLRTYQHDLLDKVLFILSNRTQDDYSDHLIQIPLDKPLPIAIDQEIGSKLIKLSLASLATTPPFPTFIKRAYLLLLAPPLPPPATPTTPLHLRTTVLLN